MDVFEAIHTRTSVSTMTDKEPPREEIERMLDAAIQAPNHRLTEPWRFRVLRGDARNILGGALAEVAASAGLDSVAQEKARAKPLRSPVVIIVTAKDGKDEVETFENRYAVAAAVQNMLLAAHALGLATIWRSGAPIYSDPVRKALGLGDDENVMGAIYVGYAKGETKPRRRRPFGEFTEWLDF